MSRCQTRRDARNLAISSKKSEWRVEEEREPRREVVDAQAALDGGLDVGHPVGDRERQLLDRGRAGLADVVAADATRCSSAASRAVPNSIVSVTRRIDGAGGKRYSFWATNSLRMSFWVVPSRRARGTPAFSAATMYIAQIGAAGELMVIEVLTRSSGRPAEQDLHVGQARHGDAARPELALGLGVVGVVAVQGRHVVGDREARSARHRAAGGSGRSCPRRRRSPANMRIVQSRLR